MSGYIFINNKGQYAVEKPNTGFGVETNKLDWSSDLNEAVVFYTQTPWAGGKKHLAALKYAQTLKANVIRTVTISSAYEGED